MADPGTFTASCRVRFVGVGSPHGDDRAGWWLAQRLNDVGRPEIGPPAVSIASVASPIDLLESLERVERLDVCDAFVGNGPPGRLYRWQWPESEIQHTRFVGSHDISLAATLALAQNLGMLPDEVVVWGIDVGPTPQCLPDVAEPVQAFGDVDPASQHSPTGPETVFSTWLQIGLESAVHQIVTELKQVVRHA